MKGKGTVSQGANTSIATRLAAANTAHATSTHSSLTRPSGQERLPCEPNAGRDRQPRERGTCPGAWSPGGEPIALTAHRFDQLQAEIPAQPPHADGDAIRGRADVGPRH